MYVCNNIFKPANIDAYIIQFDSKVVFYFIQYTPIDKIRGMSHIEAYVFLLGFETV